LVDGDGGAMLVVETDRRLLTDEFERAGFSVAWDEVEDTLTVSIRNPDESDVLALINYSYAFGGKDHGDAYRRAIARSPKPISLLTFTVFMNEREDDD
jgi:hypothetical protein